MKRIIPPLIMLAPSLIGVMILYIIPLINNFSECFTEGVNEKVYVGFKNFTDLFSNKAFAPWDGERRITDIPQKTLS